MNPTSITMRPLIAAIATAPGQGGVGIVRLSGSFAEIQTVAQAVLGKLPEPRQALYHSFLDDQGEVIDKGISLYFPAPHSFTGEHVLELQGHGGSAVLDLTLQRCMQCGARLAAPGEFTHRAFLNNKIDLAQAEAIADVIAATTSQAARAATRSMSGVFSKAVNAIVQELIELRMLVEALIDFPEEELDFLERYPIREPLSSLHSAVAALIKKAHAGVWLQRGMNIVLLGAPNVGKSSLLNSLIGDEVAIVTPIAGTTRDPVRHSLQIKGIPVHVVDTAGVRKTSDIVEQMGIDRSWKEANRADLIVLMQACGDVDSAREIESCLEQLPPDIPQLWVHNKVDVVQQAPRCEKDCNSITHVYLSARTAEGLKHFESAVLDVLNVELNPAEDTFMARNRHLEALKLAQSYIVDAENVWDAYLNHGIPLEIIAESLRAAQQALNSITGEFTADDLLGVIFGQFCIGK
ncbi:MAG: tRNA uridine-5-carboxymethylaminomethyl(34) synthesis GTPase MnmE [Pseudomonadota bacterium]